MATQDIANVAVRLFKDKSWKDQDSIGVLGPKDLTYGELATIMSEVLEKEISYIPVANEEFKANLQKFGSSEAAAQGLVDIYFSMTKNPFNHVPRWSATSSPTEFRDWCVKELLPQIKNS